MTIKINKSRTLINLDQKNNSGKKFIKDKKIYEIKTYISSVGFKFKTPNLIYNIIVIHSKGQSHMLSISSILAN